jgi:hypothetical protein
MNRYWIINPEVYETIRQQMDTESGFPNNVAVTWCNPATECLHDDAGNCVVALMPAISERFTGVSGATELTEETFRALVETLQPPMEMTP